jgi:hypothetical protein
MDRRALAASLSPCRIRRSATRRKARITTTMTPLAPAKSQARLTAAAGRLVPRGQEVEDDERDEGPGADEGQLAQQHVPPRACRTSLSTAGPDSPGTRFGLRSQAAPVVPGTRGQVVGGTLDGHPRPDRRPQGRPRSGRARSGRGGPAGHGGLTSALLPGRPGREGFPPAWRFSALH